METAEFRIEKAKIKLQGRSPFFSYLALYIKLKKATKEEMPMGTMGISADGTLYYNEDFIMSLTNEEVMGILCHEILHVALVHILRTGTRERQKWNIAIDLATNTILINDGFQLPKNGLIPKNNEFILPAHLTKSHKPYIMENLNEMTAEEIYDKFPELDYKEDKNGMPYEIRGFDEHKTDNKKTASEKSDLENEWLNRLEEAYVSSKSKGALPSGLERYINEIKKSQINWKALLRKYIQAQIPYDYSYCKRGKKSFATNKHMKKFYFPSVEKEKIEICIGIDLSGSIGKEELTEFISEIIGISKAFYSNIKMRLLTHDVDVHNDYEICNGNIEKIKKLKLKGGGGTSHEPIFKYIDEKVKDCKAVVFFTDGYSDLEDIEFSNHRWGKIFIINKQGTDNNLKNRSDCVCIKMKDY